MTDQQRRNILDGMYRAYQLPETLRGKLWGILQSHDRRGAALATDLTFATQRKDGTFFPARTPRKVAPGCNYPLT